MDKLVSDLKLVSYIIFPLSVAVPKIKEHDLLFSYFNAFKYGVLFNPIAFSICYLSLFKINQQWAATEERGEHTAKRNIEGSTYHVKTEILVEEKNIIWVNCSVSKHWTDIVYYTKC